jgi:hypothetical protein
MPNANSAARASRPGRSGTRPLRRALLVTVAALFAAGAAWGSSANWLLYKSHGVTLRFPPSWHATTVPLTHVTDPVQIVAIASYPLPDSNRGDDGCQPKEALDHLPATGAFIYGWEDPADSVFGPPRASDFPVRPAHFKLTGYGQYECSGPGYMLAFRDSGRFFQLHVALGRRASAATRQEVLRILDSFRAKRR